MFWYLLIFIGVFFEGEFTIIAASIARYNGFLNLYALMVTALLGSYLGDWLFFELGRSRGPGFVKRWPALERRVKIISGFLKKYPTITLLVLRFQIAMRTIGDLALGLSGISRKRFLIVNAVACFIWAVVITYLCGEFVPFMAKLVDGFLTSIA